MQKSTFLGRIYGTAIAFAQPFRPLFVGIQKRGHQKISVLEMVSFKPSTRLSGLRFFPNFVRKHDLKFGMSKKNSWILNQKSSCKKKTCCVWNVCGSLFFGGVFCQAAMVENVNNCKAWANSVVDHPQRRPRHMGSNLRRPWQGWTW